ncbi:MULTISPECIES: hypothetical protein [unclassified Mucilaginibacter]|uniref:hypothetical protein n=1 Tax=unclassified Mucilaginibacter TaxID=2617802 RepID=UPI0016111E39|nr:MULTISPECIES: hypothetical protein [unclassified Mucilaginibacter]MBB5397805.1 hypothetical protein [Mucilaginibacter sp. AK015]
MKNAFYKGRFIFIPIGIAAILALASFVVMQLWNHLLPDILHVTTISFWQAMGIFILCKILFGFGGPKGRGGAPWMRRKQMMQERLAGMSPEERERFKEQMKDRCGWGGRGRHRDDWRDAWKDAPIAEKESKTE